MATSNDTTTESDNDDEPVDFLQQSLMNAEDELDGEDEPISSATESQSHDQEKHYNSRKPLWWKKISGKPTKAQKRSMTAMEAFRLPKLEYGQILDWGSIFSAPQDIWLEIGFGTGDNLLALAHKCPNRCFVGAEVHTAGLGKLCQRMHQAIERGTHWMEYDEFTEEKENQHNEVDPNPPNNNTYTTINELSSSSTDLYSNLRFYGGDGVKLLPYIPSNSLSAVLVTFPDPFPKDTQAEYRVVQQHTLLEFHRTLKDKGYLYLATDHQGHFEWCHQVVDQVNRKQSLFSLVEDTDRREWLPVISKYEQKGWNEGRQTHLSCWKVIK